MPEGIVSGEELKTLYVTYGFMLHRRCLRLLGDSSDAEDVVHEIFERLQSETPPREGVSPLPWLYAIALNRCRDRARKRRREEDGAAQSGELDAPAPGTAQAEPERRIEVSRVLNALDARTCEIGVLHHVDGLTQEEICAQTGYSRKTVGRKIHLFEALFRERWSQEGGR